MRDRYQFDLVTTKTGDGGKTSTFTGSILAKDDITFETVGTIDELSSHLGLLRHVIIDAPVKGIKNMSVRSLARKKLLEIQDHLYKMMALIATDPDHELYESLEPLVDKHIEFLEQWEKGLMLHSEIEMKFVPPGGDRHSAYIDIARTVCRRAERLIVRFIRDEARFDLHISSRYLNRLSDALFILARWAEQNRAIKKRKLFEWSPF